MMMMMVPIQPRTLLIREWDSSSTYCCSSVCHWVNSSANSRSISSSDNSIYIRHGLYIFLFACAALFLLFFASCLTALACRCARGVNGSNWDMVSWLSRAAWAGPARDSPIFAFALALVVTSIADDGWFLEDVIFFADGFLVEVVVAAYFRLGACRGPI